MPPAWPAPRRSRSTSRTAATASPGSSTERAACRNVVGLGVPLEQAIAAATAVPARALRSHGVGLGQLVPGGRADVTVLDDALRVRQVLVAGREL